MDDKDKKIIKHRLRNLEDCFIFLLNQFNLLKELLDLTKNEQNLLKVKQEIFLIVNDVFKDIYYNKIITTLHNEMVEMVGEYLKTFVNINESKKNNVNNFDWDLVYTNFYYWLDCIGKLSFKIFLKDLGFFFFIQKYKKRK